jgi:AraC-like DNA-binding protein
MRPQFEKVPLREQSSLTIREFILPAFDAPLHFHPEYELTYILAGQGHRVIGDHVSHFQAGDLVLIGPNLPHYWHSERKEVSANAMSHAIVIQFAADFLGKDFFKTPELLRIQRLLEKSDRGLAFSPSLPVEIKTNMQELLLAEGAQRVIRILTMLDQLAHYQGDFGKSLATPAFSSYSQTADCERINRVCQYVFNHFSEDVNLSQAAALTNLSNQAFCLYFKKRTRRSFTEFVNEIRIGHACKLLIETDLPITQICFSCGYRNLSHFNRQFKAITKASPLLYRRQVRI